MYRIKTAALGGTGSDKSFEEAVSNLAHEFLNDKAPNLMKSELGFQMLDKSDDDSKGVGVCVFKPNDILMFVPIFFLHGEVKGHELLYLPEQDLFVPLKEQWVNELLGKKPAMVGDPIDKSFQRQHGGLQPDLSVFRTPPKIASYLNPAIAKAVPNLVPCLKKFIACTGLDFSKTAALMVSSAQQLSRATNLRRFLKYASTRSIKRLHDLVNSSLLTKKAFAQRFPDVNLEKMASIRDTYKRSKNFLTLEPDKDWRDKLFPTKKQADGYVSIISYSATLTDGSPFDLSDSEKERLAKQQYLVVDKRSDGSISRVVKGPQHLINPTESGAYSALMADGTWQDIIVVRRIEVEGQYSPAQAMNNYIIFKPSEKSGVARSINRVYTREKYPKDKFKSWFNSLPKCTDYEYLNDHAYHLNFVSPDGTCYGPVGGKISRQGDVIRIENNAVEVHIGGTGATKLKKRGSILRVPTDCRVCIDNYDAPDFIFGEPELIRYSEGKDLQTVKLSTAYDWCTINGKHYPTKFAGFCSLIKDYNMREQDAKALFKQADANVGNYHTASVYLKRAADINNPEEINKRPESDMYFPEETEGTNPLFGDLVPTAPSQMQTVTTSEEYLSPNTGPYEKSLNSPYPAEDAMLVQQALQSGQDEIFDLSMLKQFLNDGDVSTEIDEEIPELIRGMNHTGRMLFRYYWKGEQFKELYGPQELPELEASLKKIFELLGDIILLLRHRIKKDDTYGELSKLNLADADD